MQPSRGDELAKVDAGGGQDDRVVQPDAARAAGVGRPHRALTAILAGVFTAAVGLAQRIFVAVSGEKSDAAIVLTTLVVATLYAPLRRRLEAIVDRRFKYDQHRFGAYRSEVRQRLSLIDPMGAAERLALETVRELAATGAAVVDDADLPSGTAGTWPVPPVVRLPIPSGSGALWAVLVGPRVDGRPHDPRSIVELQELATLVAAAALRPEREVSDRAGSSRPQKAET